MINVKIPFRERLIGGGFILAAAALGLYQFDPLCQVAGAMAIGGITTFLIVGGVYFLFNGPMISGPRYMWRVGIYLQALSERISEDGDR